MEIRRLNAVTPGQRHQVVFSNYILGKNSLIVKNLVKDFRRKKGRCLSSGLITMRHRGGGCKNLYRMMYPDLTDIPWRYPKSGLGIPTV